MPVGFGKYAITSRGRPLSLMAHLKSSIVEVKAEANSLAHALVIAIAKVDKDTNYKAYIQGRKIRHVVETLLETTGIDYPTVREFLNWSDSKNTFGITR